MPHPPLPPLPPVWDDRGAPLTGSSIVDILATEHDELRSLAIELAEPATPPERRARIADVLSATLSRHLSAEEQYLLPTVRRMLPDGNALVEREIAADQAIRHTLRRLEVSLPVDRGYDRLSLSLCAQVARHAEDAAREILPALFLACTDEELARLGSRIEIAEEAAPTRPHVAAPTTPPWNRILDPGLGVVDKVRDVLSGRATYRVDP